MAHVRVCSCRDGMEAHFIRSLLETQGIPAIVLGESLSQATGGLPVSYTLPEIWVPPADADRASGLVADVRNHKSPLHQQPDWQCAHCGQWVEGQFTDCWKCQSPRIPEDAGSASSPLDEAEPFVDVDLPCHRCSYNLRALPASSRCPECGLPIIQTLLAVRGMATHVSPHILHAALRRLASGLGFEPGAVLFLFDAYGEMLDLAGLEAAVAADDFKTLNIPLFCKAIARSAVDHFGSVERAREQFERWGLRTPADLARALSPLWAASPEEIASHFLQSAESSIF